MKSRERILKVMNLETPDRVPFDGLIPTRSDFLYSGLVPAKSWQPADKQGVYPNVVSIFMKLGLWKWKPKNWTPPKNWNKLPRIAVDEFGVEWDYTAADVTKGHPTGAPMKSWNMLENWEFPDPYDESHYKFFVKTSKLFPNKFKVGTLDSFLFARLQYLRGFSQSLLDLSRNRKYVETLMKKLQDYYIGTIEMWHKYGYDAVMTMDDMGAQHELFMSPRLYKKFIVPPFKEIVKRAHELDMKFLLHSCGHVNELLPVWIDIGVDGVQFDSPRMTGIDFNSQFADKICFMMVPDIQKVYPFATVDELELEIKKMIRKIGHNGGLIIRDYYSARKVLHVPDTNYKALPKFVKKWGKYPLDWL